MGSFRCPFFVTYGWDTDMGIYYKVPDWDRDFSKLSFEPIILNREWPGVDEKTDIVTSLMVTRFENSFEDIQPHCACGATTGRHNHVCVKCGGAVMSIFDHGFTSDVWLQTPTGINAFIIPNFLQMLLRTFRKANDRFDAIEYLLDPAYSVPDKRDADFRAFLDLGIPRGYNNFVDNFDDIFERILESKIFGGNTSTIRKLRQFVEENRDLLFPKHVPLPSKYSIITEKSTSGIEETDRSMLTIVDSARMLFALENKNANVSQRVRDSQVFRALKFMISYRDYVDRKIIARKPGWLRKQVFGTRIGPSGRGVITSLVGQHRYNAVRPPIGIGLVMYFPEITGELQRRGYTPNAAAKAVYEAMVIPNREVYDILNVDMMKKSPYAEGLPCVMSRPPILDKRSIQQLYIEQFKEDLDDSTIGLPIETTRAFNADFDGDQMAIRPQKSREDVRALSAMATEVGLVDLNRPGQHNSNMGLPVPIITTLNELIY